MVPFGAPIFVMTTKYRYHPDGYLIYDQHRYKKYVGRRAGCTDNLGYRRVRYHGKNHLEHRVIWHIHHGYWPTEIDHINRIRDDNRIENLREVTHAENIKNQHPFRGGKGVYQSPSGKWRVHFKGYYKGGFDTKEEAEKDCRIQKAKILNNSKYV